ncbi:MAG TPA: hypothetical protein PKK15_15805, partial [Kouleothrix sp.]|nr:hypothetical protein [Kouleothrix sp.]
PLVLCLGGVPPLRALLLLTPDAEHGRPIALEFQQLGAKIEATIAELAVWAVVVCVLHSQS